MKYVLLAVLALLVESAPEEACSSPEICSNPEENPDFNVLIQNKIGTVAASDQETLVGDGREQSGQETLLGDGREQSGQEVETTKPRASSKSKKKKRNPPAHGKNQTRGGHGLHAQSMSTQKQMRVSLGIIGVLFIGSFLCLFWAGSSKQFQWDLSLDDNELEERSSSPLDEDMYGLAVSLLVRDTAVLEAGEGHGLLRQLRFALVFLLVFMHKALQVFLVFQVLRLVTPKAMQTSRSNYDKFEWHMYGEDPSHFKILPDGTRRGLPGFFQPELFDTLGAHIKEDTCHIPFSQPVFFIVVLFVWALTCIGDLKKGVDMFNSLILSTPTVGALEHMVESPSDMKSNKMLIVGLTWRKKVFITAIILVPRAILTTVLLWLGSRWLASTNNFGDLIMNTVALEFILLLQNLLYMTMVPARNKRDCQSIETAPPHTHEKAGLYVFTGSILWGVVAFAWAMVYTYYLQRVLPSYNWDVRDVCAEWLSGESGK